MPAANHDLRKKLIELMKNNPKGVSVTQISSALDVSQKTASSLVSSLKNAFVLRWEKNPAPDDNRLRWSTVRVNGFRVNPEWLPIWGFAFDCPPPEDRRVPLTHYVEHFIPNQRPYPELTFLDKTNALR